MRTDNDFLFGSNGKTLGPMVPIVITTQEQAYRTAAWIEAMAIILPHEEEKATYEEIREAVRNT